MKMSCPNLSQSADSHLVTNCSTESQKIALDLLDDVSKRIRLHLRGTELFENLSLNAIEFAVPDKAPDVLALLLFAKNGINCTEKQLKQMELLPFAIYGMYNITDLGFGDQALDPSPFMMVPVKVEELPEVNSVRAYLKNGQRSPNEALAPLITLPPGMVDVSLRTVEETCMMILLIIHRLAKLTDAQISALTITSSMVKSSLRFFQNASFPLFKEIVSQMNRTSALRYFRIGERLVQQYAICWEKFRRAFASSVTEKIFDFALMGLKYEGFLALNLVRQACERINMTPDEMLRIINNNYSENMLNLLKAREKFLNDPESWYPLMHPISSRAECDFSANNHPQMAYIGHMVCAPSIPGVSEPDWAKIEPWAKKIHPQLRSYLRSVANILKNYKRQTTAEWD